MNSILHPPSQVVIAHWPLALYPEMSFGHAKGLVRPPSGKQKETQKEETTGRRKKSPARTSTDRLGASTFLSFVCIPYRSLTAILCMYSRAAAAPTPPTHIFRSIRFSRSTCLVGNFAWASLRTLLSHPKSLAGSCRRVHLRQGEPVLPQRQNKGPHNQ